MGWIILLLVLIFLALVWLNYYVSAGINGIREDLRVVVQNSNHYDAHTVKGLEVLEDMSGRLLSVEINTRHLKEMLEKKLEPDEGWKYR